MHKIKATPVNHAGDITLRVHHEHRQGRPRKVPITQDLLRDLDLMIRLGDWGTPATLSF